MADETTIPDAGDSGVLLLARALATVLKDVETAGLTDALSGLADVLYCNLRCVVIDANGERHSKLEAAPAAPATWDFDEFVGAYRDRLVGMARRHLGPRHADYAEDLVQAALAVVWQHRTEITSPYAYAVTVTNRLVTRHLSADARLRVGSPVDDLPSQPSGLEADAVALLIDLKRAIRQLPRRQREVMRLLMAGKKHQEIADLLGIQPGTVRAHLHAARKALLAYLGEDGESDGQ